MINFKNLYLINKYLKKMVDSMESSATPAYQAFRKYLILILFMVTPTRIESSATPAYQAFRKRLLLFYLWWPRRESNSYLAFRKRLFYPLNYSAKIKCTRAQKYKIIYNKPFTSFKFTYDSGI